MTAKRLMIVGTGSSVGKSLMVAGLCRVYKRRGVKVAPFKSQNMALNSFITPEGHEMGRAQVTQAEAAGLTPSALMNPILLKPTADHKSQVIVNGKVYGNMSAPEYYAFRHNLKGAVMAAFDKLAAAHELVIIEGAGSPAEINLKENDLVNMGMAKMAQAPVVLVGDIDRGGVFASLYGTVKLLPEDEQKMVKGLIVNKFRGAVSILEPGLRQIEELLKMPVLGVLPYYDVKIDEEDSLTERFKAARRGGALEAAVIRLPRLSNFTDFAALDIQPDLALRYVGAGELLGRPDLIIIPGSKNTIEDMAWLEQTGLAAQVKAAHAEGAAVIGVCGGFQMMGKIMRDPLGTESEIPELPGLGLLDVDTTFEPEKRTAQSEAVIVSGRGLLAPCRGMKLQGYEIHMGRSRRDSGEAFSEIDGHAEGAVSENGAAFGTYLHGLFDNLDFTRAILNGLREKKNLPPLAFDTQSFAEFKEAEYERLADIIEKHLDLKVLDAIIEAR